jgi:Sulfotransferase family
MIVSFQHRFIFVAIPKTATHAFRVALRPYLGSRDWEQCVLFEQKFFPVEALARVGHGHITCRQIQPFLLPAFWETSFRFCTVRNPYDRFVSYCCFVNRANQRMQDEPLETMKQIIRDNQASKHILFRPQCEFVTDEEGRLLVDYVCRFEALQEHFDHICRRICLPASQLPQINVSRQARYRSSYDRELQEIVYEVYQEDFALFDYPAVLPIDLKETVACE